MAKKKEKVPEAKPETIPEETPIVETLPLTVGDAMEGIEAIEQAAEKAIGEQTETAQNKAPEKTKKIKDTTEEAKKKLKKGAKGAKKAVQEAGGGMTEDEIEAQITKNKKNMEAAKAEQAKTEMELGELKRTVAEALKKGGEDQETPPPAQQPASPSNPSRAPGTQQFNNAEANKLLDAARDARDAWVKDRKKVPDGEQLKKAWRQKRIEYAKYLKDGGHEIEGQIYLFDEFEFETKQEMGAGEKIVAKIADFSEWWNNLGNGTGGLNTTARITKSLVSSTIIIGMTAFSLNTQKAATYIGNRMLMGLGGASLAEAIRLLPLKNKNKFVNILIGMLVGAASAAVISALMPVIASLIAGGAVVSASAMSILTAAGFGAGGSLLSKGIHEGRQVLANSKKIDLDFSEESLNKDKKLYIEAIDINNFEAIEKDIKEALVSYNSMRALRFGADCVEKLVVSASISGASQAIQHFSGENTTQNSTEQAPTETESKGLWETIKGWNPFGGSAEHKGDSQESQHAKDNSTTKSMGDLSNQVMKSAGLNEPIPEKPAPYEFGNQEQSDGTVSSTETTTATTSLGPTAPTASIEQHTTPPETHVNEHAVVTKADEHNGITWVIKDQLLADKEMCEKLHIDQDRLAHDKVYAAHKTAEIAEAEGLMKKGSDGKWQEVGVKAPHDGKAYAYELSVDKDGNPHLTEKVVDVDLDEKGNITKIHSDKAVVVETHQKGDAFEVTKTGAGEGIEDGTHGKSGYNFEYDRGEHHYETPHPAPGSSHTNESLSGDGVVVRKEGEGDLNGDGVVMKKAEDGGDGNKTPSQETDIAKLDEWPIISKMTAGDFFAIPERDLTPDQKQVLDFYYEVDKADPHIKEYIETHPDKTMEEIRELSEKVLSGNIEIYSNEQVGKHVHENALEHRQRIISRATESGTELGTETKFWKHHHDDNMLEKWQHYKNGDSFMSGKMERLMHEITVVRNEQLEHDGQTVKISPNDTIDSYLKKLTYGTQLSHTEDALDNYYYHGGKDPIGTPEEPPMPKPRLTEANIQSNTNDGNGNEDLAVTNFDKMSAADFIKEARNGSLINNPEAQEIYVKYVEAQEHRSIPAPGKIREENWSMARFKQEIGFDAENTKPAGSEVRHDATDAKALNEAANEMDNSSFHRNNVSENNYNLIFPEANPEIVNSKDPAVVDIWNAAHNRSLEAQSDGAKEILDAGVSGASPEVKPLAHYLEKIHSVTRLEPLPGEDARDYINRGLDKAVVDGTLDKLKLTADEMKQFNIIEASELHGIETFEEVKRSPEWINISDTKATSLFSAGMAPGLNFEPLDNNEQIRIFNYLYNKEYLPALAHEKQFGPSSEFDNKKIQVYIADNPEIKSGQLLDKLHKANEAYGKMSPDSKTDDNLIPSTGKEGSQSNQKPSSPDNMVPSTGKTLAPQQQTTNDVLTPSQGGTSAPKLDAKPASNTDGMVPSGENDKAKNVPEKAQQSKDEDNLVPSGDNTNTESNIEVKNARLLENYQAHGVAMGVTPEQFQTAYENRDKDNTFKNWAREYAPLVNTKDVEGVHETIQITKPLIDMTETKTETVNYDSLPFKDAYKKAEDAGLEVFRYKGLDYKVTNNPEDIVGTTPGALDKNPNPSDKSATKTWTTRIKGGEDK